MPFYEYVCAACGRHHEELQKVTDRPLRKCPHCGRPSLRRQVSAPVFRLKGGGWYETDFKKDQEGKRNLAGDEEPDKPKEEKLADKAAGKPDAAATPDAAAGTEAAKPAAKAAPARAKGVNLRRRKPRP